MNKELIVQYCVLFVATVGSAVGILLNDFPLLCACLVLVVLGIVQLRIFQKCYRLPVEELFRVLRDDEFEKQFENVRARDTVINTLFPIIEEYSGLKIKRNNAEIFNKQTELTALQSQINPHFLYNTLDTIRGRAMLDDNDEVAKMIETLASFFRYSISKKGNLVTLRDELNNINAYMEIQRYRFRDRFKLEVIIEEEDKSSYDFYIPRLILQPIIENSITHGLGEKTDGGKIIIDVVIANDLIITVSDNGKGMTLSELDNLNARIHSREVNLYENEEDDSYNTGIGLPNINRRITLQYGRQYGINVYSSSGCGADVEITLPIINRIEE